MDKTARNINNATIIVAILLILGFAWLYMPGQLPWAIFLCLVLVAIDIYYNSMH
jgi:hypothetical protein